MSDINQLLQAYKTLTDTIAESQSINKKIFNEMIASKIRKSFIGIKLFEYLGTLLCIIYFPYLIYWVYVCRTKLDVFCMSIALVALFIVFSVLFYKQFKFKLTSQLSVENDMRETLYKMREVSILLRRQRRIGTYFMIPILILELPVGWYAIKNFYYIDLIKYHWEHSLWYLIALPIVLGMGVYITWKLYDWIYFSTFKKVEENIKMLSE